MIRPCHRLVSVAFACAALAVVACSSEVGSPSADPDGGLGAADNASEDLRVFNGGECVEASQCHGSLPEICTRCEDGERRCAHFECEDNQCVAELCPPPAVPQCVVAADCHGPLPELCERCIDGNQACAHHECEGGRCVVQVCPPPARDAGPSPVIRPL